MAVLRPFYELRDVARQCDYCVQNYGREPRPQQPDYGPDHQRLGQLGQQLTAALGDLSSGRVGDPQAVATATQELERHLCLLVYERAYYYGDSEYGTPRGILDQLQAARQELAVFATAAHTRELALEARRAPELSSLAQAPVAPASAPDPALDIDLG